MKPLEENIGRTLSDINQTETNKIWYHLNMESEKIIQMNLFTKQKQTYTHRKQT